ncbi:MAG: hypothetical protein ACQEP1_04125 [Nanobdellota archaeon]
MNKRGINSDQIVDIVSAMILIALLLVVYSIISSQEGPDDIVLREARQKNLLTYEVSTLLRSPVESGVSMETDELNISGKEYAIIDGKEKINIGMEEDYDSLVFDIEPVADIAVMEGYDSVDITGAVPGHPNTEDNAFLSPGADYDASDLRQWVSSGGRLIATDYAIEDLEKTFGDIPIYTEKRPIPKSPVKAEVMGQDMKIDNVFWYVKNDSEAEPLGEYKGLEKDYGHPGYRFSFGDGKIEYFPFFLSRNPLDGLFPEPSYPEDISIDVKFRAQPVRSHVGELTAKMEVSIAGPLERFIEDCSLPCDYPVTVSSKGKVMIKNIRGVKKNDEMVPQRDFADKITNAYNEGDMAPIKEKFEAMMKDYETERYEYSVQIEDEQGVIMETDYSDTGEYVSLEKVLAEFSLPLRQPGKNLTLRVKEYTMGGVQTE